MNQPERGPLISVIVATFNAGRSLTFTLNSLAAQTFRDFEVVLVDGASTDDTLMIAAAFGSLITKQISESDDGIADAWNKGVANSDGRWVIFLNAGDALHPHHFMRAKELLTHHENDVILFCDVIRFNALGEVTRRIIGRMPNLNLVRRGGIGFAHPGSFTPRHAFDVVGAFSTRFRIAIDSEFLLRCITKGFEFRKFLSCAYMAEGGLSDVGFLKALQEYYQGAYELGLVRKWEASCYPLVLGGGRPIYRASWYLLQPFLRNIKHFTVALANFSFKLVPFASFRRFGFRVLGFAMGAGSSIALGTRIYSFGKLHLGARSVVNRDCLLDNRAGIWIGENVSIARDVHIFTGGHDIHSPFFEMTTASVKIEDHSVILARSSIMPGVTVGCGAVVYPGSVVTKNVLPYSIVAGVPAKVIGSRASKSAYRLKYPYPTAM